MMVLALRHQVHWVRWDDCLGESQDGEPVSLSGYRG